MAILVIMIARLKQSKNYSMRVKLLGVAILMQMSALLVCGDVGLCRVLCPSEFPNPMKSFKYIYTHSLLIIANQYLGSLKISMNTPINTRYFTMSQSKQLENNHIIQIQKKLNSLCCEHDSMMPLLELNSYSSSVHRWDNSLRSINKKINEYQARLNALRSRDREENIVLWPPLASGDQELSPQIEKRNKNGELEQEVLEVKQLLNDLLFGKSENNSYFSKRGNQNINSALVQVKSQSKQKLDELDLFVEKSLALFQNEQSLSQLSAEEDFLQNSTVKVKSSHFPIKKIIEKMEYEKYMAFLRQIEAIRSGLLQIEDIVSLQNFHVFTYDRLGSELLETNENVEEIFKVIISKREERTTEATKVALQRTEHRLGLAHWQILGMRKKYYHSLTQLYHRSQDKFEVHEVERKLSKDVRELLSTYEEVKNKLDYLKNQLKC